MKKSKLSSKNTTNDNPQSWEKYDYEDTYEADLKVYNVININYCVGLVMRKGNLSQCGREETELWATNDGEKYLCIECGHHIRLTEV